MAKKLDAKVFSSFLTKHKEFLKSQQGRHVADTPEHADYQSALDNVDQHLEMCKTMAEDELSKGDQDTAANLESKLATVVADSVAKALGDQVLRGNVSRLAPAAPTFRAVPRFGAPEARKVAVPAELEHVLGRNPEYLDEV